MDGIFGKEEFLEKVGWNCKRYLVQSVNLL
jgi:hypothetical protein